MGWSVCVWGGEGGGLCCVSFVGWTGTGPLKNRKVKKSWGGGGGGGRERSISEWPC